MKLSDMSVYDILQRIDFSTAIVAEFKEWCKDKEKLPAMSGFSAWLPNPFLKQSPGFFGNSLLAAQNAVQESIANVAVPKIMVKENTDE